MCVSVFYSFSYKPTNVYRLFCKSFIELTRAAGRAAEVERHVSGPTAIQSGREQKIRISGSYVELTSRTPMRNKPHPAFLTNTLLQDKLNKTSL